MQGIRYVLWDFGDTLADQRWMWPSPDGVPGWTARYAALAETELDNRWSTGRLTLEELCAAFARDLGCAPEPLLAHAATRCADLRFYEHVWSAARRHVMRQAIVTVNADLFTRFVVPNYDLDTTFDAIVTSWQMGTLDKADLCVIALAQLGGADPAEALLIDNLAANVDAWQARGGAGYLFRDDATFARDNPLGLVEDA